MKEKLTLSIIISIIICSVWIGVSEATVENIAGGVVRLHIIANSDSAEDQALKLKVRDRILKEVRNNTDTNQIDLEYVQNNKEKLVAICEDEIQRNGYSYPVDLETGNFYFPTKSYENISLPAGNYNAVKIIIGEGMGQNWWCVMYPPLCFTSETKGALSDAELEQLKNSMSKENFDLISGEDAHTVVLRPSFKIVEMWQTVKHKIQG